MAQANGAFDRRQLLRAAAVAVSSLAHPAIVRAREPLKFGLTPVFLTSDLVLLETLQSYLSKAMGADVRLVQRRTYQEITSQLVAGQIDAAWICGYAWAPQHGVNAVEYRVDGGPWQRANIQQPNLGKYTWVRFSFPWDATAGEHVIETRTTDNAGVTQVDVVLSM